jgi:hypothetical protein
MTVETALAWWSGFQAGGATWPLTTCTRAENAPELLLDSRTGARGELGLQRTVAYVWPHRPDHAPSAALLPRASGPQSAIRGLSDARVEDRAVTSRAVPTRVAHPLERRMRRNSCHTVLVSSVAGGPSVS